MIPAVGKSGAGTMSISSSTVISGLASSARQAFDDLGQVVRRDVGRHPDRDAGRAVDEQVRQPRRQDRRLHLLAVVVRREVDGFLVDVGEHLGGDLLQPAFGVAVRRGAVAVDRAEVALAVDQRVAQREVLHHPHQRLVGRRCRRAGGTCRARRRRRARISRTAGSRRCSPRASRTARAGAPASGRRGRPAAPDPRSRSSRNRGRNAAFRLRGLPEGFLWQTAPWAGILLKGVKRVRRTFRAPPAMRARPVRKVDACIAGRRRSAAPADRLATEDRSCGRRAEGP